jgi:hypothetical protein
MLYAGKRHGSLRLLRPLAPLTVSVLSIGFVWLSGIEVHGAKPILDLCLCCWHHHWAD